MAGAEKDLLSFVSAMGGERALRVEENLGEGYVRLRVSEAERRQAKQDVRCVEDAVIELLRNARDAGARHVYVATSREGDLRATTVLDDGAGIPEDMHERVFEARVTSKLDSVRTDRWGVHGRGMELFSIRENAVSAGVASTVPGGGAAIRVVKDATRLPERADQSSWPEVEAGEGGALSCVRGPHNIVRTCCEFALDEHPGLEVYLGSPAEIVATARARAATTVDPSELLFLDSLEGLPVLERLRVSADAAELRAHRIVSGEIRPIASVASRLTGRSAPPVAREVDLVRDRRGLRVSREDLEEFTRALERDFDLLAERYYLSLSSDPKVRVGRGRITVTFDLEEAD